MDAVNVYVSQEEEYQWLEQTSHQLDMPASAVTTPSIARDMAYRIYLSILCKHGAQTIEEVMEKDIRDYQHMVRARNIHNSTFTAH